MSKKLLSYNLSEPLNGATKASIDINASTGNLTIEKLTSIEQLLVSGTLQYFEGQDLPFKSLEINNGKAILTLKSGAPQLSWFRLPWKAFMGAFEWRIYITSALQSELTAHSDGGNVKLNLADITVSRLMVDTSGGNINVILPDSATNLSVTAKTGGGNLNIDVGRSITGNNTIEAGSGAGKVVVRLPGGIDARIHATSGLGKVIVDSRFTKIDRNVYQSNGYDTTPDKVEVRASSGAGNVSVIAK